MTIKSIIFLKKLKKAQIDESRIVWINSETSLVKTVGDSNELCCEVNLDKFKTSINSILSHLSKHGLIYNYADSESNQSEFCYIRVTHAGWNWGQTFTFGIIKYAFTSVVMPIFVSILTTIITLYINGCLFS